jgi:hypothetical protein
MSDQKPKSPDSLTKADNVALAESELDKVAGGDSTVTVNKVKTADKQFQAMDAYVRG